MIQASHDFAVVTKGQGLYKITDPVARWVGDLELQTGLLTVFIQHTSASLVIQENADRDVLTDLNEFFKRLVPEDEPLYRHIAEGPDDMPAHIRTVLTHTQLSIPVHEGRLALGTWQGIYIFEHRRDGHRRKIVLHACGEAASKSNL